MIHTPVTARGRVKVTYGQFLITDGDSVLDDQLNDPASIRSVAGFIQVATGFVRVSVNTDTRFVGVTVHIRDGADDTDVTDDCEGEAEFDVEFPRPATVGGLDDIDAPPDRRLVDGDLRSLSIPPGRYRMRVTGTGMNAALAERDRGEIANPQDQPTDPDLLTERFTIWVWPNETSAATVVHRQYKLPA